MTVADLIERLLLQPQDASVRILFDHFCCSDIECVLVDADDGAICLADEEDASAAITHQGYRRV